MAWTAQHWQVELLRVRGGEPHSWILEACDATGHLALPAALAERPAAAEEPRRAARDKPLVTAMMQGQRRVLASVDDAAARARS